MTRDTAKPALPTLHLAVECFQVNPPVPGGIAVLDENRKAVGVVTLENFDANVARLAQLRSGLKAGRGGSQG